MRQGTEELDTGVNWLLFRLAFGCPDSGAVVKPADLSHIMLADEPESLREGVKIGVFWFKMSAALKLDCMDMCSCEGVSKCVTCGWLHEQKVKRQAIN